MMNALRVGCIAEKALILLFSEENIISSGQMEYLATEFKGDMDYINGRLLENRKLQVGDGPENSEK